MRFSPAPPSVQAAMAMPGRCWGEQQVLAAFDWLFGDNFARLVRVAAHWLGSHLASDAEDECQNFAVDRFRRVVRHYDPVRGGFEGFVVVCLKRYCGARARVLAPRAARRAPLDGVALVDLRATATPESRLLGDEARKTAIPKLHHVLAAMSRRDRRLLQMGFHGVPMADRATALALTYNVTKTAACRARQRLERELEREPKGFALRTGGAR